MFSVENEFCSHYKTKKMACQAHIHLMTHVNRKPGSQSQTPVAKRGRNLCYKLGFGFFFNFNPPLWGSWM